ncbi:unnamed protein product [Phytomonas sp. EM1]|nr:unnamed protein product [Phytomonas sp. EM1]|eukprot:CCW59890.1 unnamed protein product [Phytomonas sp. isolate EM1]
MGGNVESYWTAKLISRPTAVSRQLVMPKCGPPPPYLLDIVEGIIQSKRKYLFSIDSLLKP